MAEAIYRVLTCDGGGIRGVITAKLLQALDRSVLDSIDLFAGTSTGSIIALGLASGVPIDTIVDLYSSQECCSQDLPALPTRGGAGSDRRGARNQRGGDRRHPRCAPGPQGAVARAGADPAVPEVPQRRVARAPGPPSSRHDAGGGLDEAEEGGCRTELSAQRRRPVRREAMAGAAVQQSSARRLDAGHEGDRCRDGQRRGAGLFPAARCSPGAGRQCLRRWRRVRQ